MRYYGRILSVRIHADAEQQLDTVTERARARRGDIVREALQRGLDEIEREIRQTTRRVARGGRR